MGAPLGSGRKYTFGFIEGLRESEIEVLKALLNWDYSLKSASYKEIALQIQISTGAVSLALWYLKNRGIIRKSTSRSWFIAESIKQRLKEELAQVEEQPSTEVQSVLLPEKL